MQRGSTIVPVLNMAEQLSNLKWKRWPKKLNELHIPIPFVIGPFLDVTKHDDPDGQEFAKEVAEKTWTTTADSENPKTQRGSLMDRVLPCSLEHGFSARYLLDSLSPESTQGMPSWHTVWADINDPTLSVGLFLGGCCVAVGFLLVFGHSAFGRFSDPRGKSSTTASRQRDLTNIFGNIFLIAS